MSMLLHRFDVLLPDFEPRPQQDAKAWAERMTEAMQELGRKGHALTMDKDAWRGALTLARLHGWEPRGTFWRGEPEQRSDDYATRMDWWVDNEDAQALAEALERALARGYIPMAAPPPDEIQLQELMSRDDACLAHHMLCAMHVLAPTNRAEMEELVSFCRRGAFQIGG